MALLATGPGAARAGGIPVGYVTLPDRGLLAVVELPSRRTVARIRLPGKPTAVAASVNGRRVLVASPTAGTVSAIDGIHDRVTRVFHGLASPVAVGFDYEPPIGIVTPRYGFVLEHARGTLAVLDLAQGRIAARLPVGAQPRQLAVEVGTVWIAHTASGALTRVDVTTPTRPRLLASVDTSRTVAGLIADPDFRSVFLSFRASRQVARYADRGGTAARAYLATIAPAPLAGIAIAAPHLLIGADGHGGLHLMREQTGRPMARLRGHLAIRSLDAYGGWLVAILPRGLGLVGVPDGSMRTSVSPGSRVGGFAWAVL